MISLKKDHEINQLTSANDWQFRTLYCILICPLIEPIRSFQASHSSRRDSETSWLLEVRTPTNLSDTFIFSQKTWRSVLEAEWVGRVKLFFLRIPQMFDRTEQYKDRTGQDDDRRCCFPRF